jgi:hypothetical protein
LFPFQSIPVLFKDLYFEKEGVTRKVGDEFNTPWEWLELGVDDEDELNNTCIPLERFGVQISKKNESTYQSLYKYGWRPKAIADDEMKVDVDVEKVFKLSVERLVVETEEKSARKRSLEEEGELIQDLKKRK